jgi:hypothetical protein
VHYNHNKIFHQPVQLGLNEELLHKLYTEEHSFKTNLELDEEILSLLPLPLPEEDKFYGVIIQIIK